jgi:hypothetical protein
MQVLEELQLTESDFKLLTDGLDALPNAGAGGEILSTLLEGMLTKDDPEIRAKVMSERKKDEKSKAAAKALQLEEIRILQGKLFQLQRYLRMNGLLKQAHETLGN